MAPAHQRDRCPVRSAEELALFLSGDLSPRRTRDLLRHLPDCGTCQQRLRELGAVRDLLHRAAVPGIPRSFTLTPAQARRGQRRLCYPLLRGLTTALAAVVLLLFALSWLLPSALEPLAPTGLLGNAESPASVSRTPLSTVVGPVITRRNPPTAGLGLVTPLPGYRTETAYPLPVQVLTPESTAGLSAAPLEPERPTAIPELAFLTLLRLGGLLVLGLVAGLTWLAYRRERVFLS